MTSQDTDQTSTSRISIIEAVQKPINFFVLVVLVVEVILGVIVNFSEGIDRTYLIIGMLALIFSLVLIVAGFAFFRPEALVGGRPVAGRPEADVSQLPPTVESINKPRFLLASASQEYTMIHLTSDEQITGEFFPKRQITVSQGITLAQLRDLLIDKHFDILHLTIPVDKEDGSLKFSMAETMSAEAFSKLVEACGAKLVVLAICDSIMLAARIARVTNMIAAIEPIENERDFQEWERMLYRMLSRGQPLSRAYEMARATINAPMVLLMKHDFVVRSE